MVGAERSVAVAGGAVVEVGASAAREVAGGAVVSGGVFDLLLQPIQGMSGAAPMRPSHHNCHQLPVAVG